MDVKRHRVEILFVATLLAAVYYVYSEVYRPNRLQMVRLDAEAAQLELDVVTKKRLSSRAAGEGWSVISDSEMRNEAKFSALMKNVSITEGIDLEIVRITTENVVNKGKFREVQFRVNAVGPFQALGEYFEFLERSRVPLRIVGVTIEKSEGEKCLSNIDIMGYMTEG